jgi:hypothetical protein
VLKRSHFHHKPKTCSQKTTTNKPCLTTKKPQFPTQLRMERENATMKMMLKKVSIECFFFFHFSFSSSCFELSQLSHKIALLSILQIPATRPSVQQLIKIPRTKRSQMMETKVAKKRSQRPLLPPPPLPPQTVQWLLLWLLL